MAISLAARLLTFLRFRLQINLTEVSRGFYHYLLANVGTTACLKVRNHILTDSFQLIINLSFCH